MIEPSGTSEILARAVRDLTMRHEAEIERVALLLLPYSYGLHEFTIERYPHQSVLRFRGFRHSVPHPTLNINPTGWGFASDRQAIDNTGDGADL